MAHLVSLCTIKWREQKVYLLVLGIYRSNNNSDWTEYKSLFDFLAYLFKFLYEGSYKPYPIFLGKQSFKNKKQFHAEQVRMLWFFCWIPGTGIIQIKSSFECLRVVPATIAGLKKKKKTILYLRKRRIHQYNQRETEVWVVQAAFKHFRVFFCIFPASRSCCSLSKGLIFHW